MVEVSKATSGWKYDVISIGYPGPVVHGKPAEEPKNLASGWVGFEYEKAFGKPVRMVNDAAMQALGGYRRGRMLFLGLGTGLGSALVVEGVLQPLELAHLPYRHNRTYEDYVGLRGYKRLGRKKWQLHVEKVVELFKHSLQADYVVLGGGQTKLLNGLPPGARLGNNANAIVGGISALEPARVAGRSARVCGCRPNLGIVRIANLNYRTLAENPGVHVTPGFRHYVERQIYAGASVSHAVLTSSSPHGVVLPGNTHRMSLART